MRGARKEKLTEADDEAGESQGAGGRGLAREEKKPRKRRERAEDGKKVGGAKPRRILYSWSSGAKPRKKTPVEARFGHHQSWPQWTKPSLEKEKMKGTPLFLGLQVWSLIFWRLFRPTQAHLSQARSRPPIESPHFPLQSQALTPPLSNSAVSGTLLETS